MHKACNIAIHALVMAVGVSAEVRAGAIKTSRPWLRLIVTMIAMVSVLMAAHTAEAAVWALGYAIVDAPAHNARRLVAPLRSWFQKVAASCVGTDEI